MIKILHIVPALVGGGVENLLLNYYRYLDKSTYSFDFIVFEEEVGEFEKIFEEFGCNIFHIPSRHKSLYRSMKGMKEIISNGNYDIIHAHQNEMSYIPLYFAKRAGIKMRIGHSHTAFKKESHLKKYIRQLYILLNLHYSTEMLACSDQAVKWSFGRSKKVDILSNAIDIGKFEFNEEIRAKIRKKLNIENKFVVGNVGRLSVEKNHMFLIDIFREIYDQNKESVLIIIGGGELEKKLKEQVAKEELEHAVFFLGVRNDIETLLQGMDVFVLPTLYEGFGIAYLEAQASGLMTFGTEKVVPKEVRITENMNYISAEKPASYWAEEVLKCSNSYKRKNFSVEIRKSGYDIKQQVKFLEALYGRSKDNV